MPINFRYMKMKEDGDVVSCHCCSSEAPLDSFRALYPEKRQLLLCEVCASTFIGAVTRGPANDPASLMRRETLIGVAQVANLLLDKLTPRQQAQDDAEILPPESDE